MKNKGLAILLSGMMAASAVCFPVLASSTAESSEAASGVTSTAEAAIETGEASGKKYNFAFN